MKRVNEDSRWKTIVKFPDYNFKIDYSSKLLALGSCFANEIGDYLYKMKFDICVNPTGVLFNPWSIAQILDILSNNYKFTSDDLFYNQELYCSFYHSSLFSKYSKEEFLNNNNKIIELASSQFNNSDYVILTFGTSWVYRHIETNLIVSNCHKMHPSIFKRESLDIDDIVEMYSKFAQKFSNKKFIITVSPIRHLKDGAIENSVSKAKLLISANELAKKHSNIYYLPIYELFIDELRDYRFYGADMVHPSDIAIDYVCDVFKNNLISDKCYSRMEDIDKLIQLMSHKPFFTQTESYKKLLAKIEDLEQKVKK